MRQEITPLYIGERVLQANHKVSTRKMQSACEAQEDSVVSSWSQGHVLLKCKSLQLWKRSGSPVEGEIRTLCAVSLNTL